MNKILALIALLGFVAAPAFAADEKHAEKAPAAIDKTVKEEHKEHKAHEHEEHKEHKEHKKEKKEDHKGAH